MLWIVYEVWNLFFVSVMLIWINEVVVDLYCWGSGEVCWIFMGG